MESPQAEVILGDIFLNNTGLYGFLFLHFLADFLRIFPLLCLPDFLTVLFCQKREFFQLRFFYIICISARFQSFMKQIFFLAPSPRIPANHTSYFPVPYLCSFLLFFLLFFFIVLSDFFLFSFSFHSAFHTGSLPFSLPSICPSIFCQPCDILKLHSDVPR